MTNPLFPIRPPYGPEFPMLARLAIERILTTNGNRPSVFEYGSGYSTPWFAKQANVISVEHNPEWHREVSAALEREELVVKTHLVAEKEMPNVIDNYGIFDLVLVDCWDFQRLPALRIAMAHVRPEGWLILDDTHWEWLKKEALEILADWRHMTISAVHERHNGQIRYHETSFFQNLPKLEIR